MVKINFLCQKQPRLRINFILLLFFFAAIKLDAQSTCATAIPLSYTINYTATSYTNSAFWFSTTINPGGISITVTTTRGSTGKVTRVDWYQSDCSTLVKTDTLVNTTDSSFVAALADTVGGSYKVKLTIAGGSTNFNLKTASGALVYILGDLGYCSGQSIALKANVWGAGSSPTYTWTGTGIVGTNSLSTVSATPTATTTYTLTYKDNQFGTFQTVTQTVTVTQLSGDNCANCQMVQNGAFESSQYNNGTVGNIKLVSTSCSGGTVVTTSDCKIWKSPTCGSPDYFGSNYNPQGNGVPINYTSNSPGTNAHSGSCYAGISTFNDDPVWPLLKGWREYLQSQLKCPLINGVTYNVSFYASLSNVLNAPSNNIGALLSVNTPTAVSFLNLSSYTPQVNYPTSLNNIGSWTKISGTVVGNGENYITVGNFYDDYSTSPYYGSHLKSYYFIDDISVTPATPTLTASGCHSGSVTISAYGAPNSTVTTWAGPNSFTATGSSITIASPTTHGATYTCTVNLNASCSSCSNITQTITISGQTPCSGTTPPSYTVTGGSLSTSPAYIASNLTVSSGTYTINAAETRIAANVTITVKSGATLVVDGSWLHVCTPCNGVMWNGIFVEAGATVITKNYSIIEDAVQAIATQSLGSVTPIPVWNVSNTIFNKNTYGIYVDAHPGDLSSNYIYGSIFTSRNIGNHTTSSANFTTIKNDITAATPVYVSASNPIDLTVTGVRSGYGIYINDNENTTAVKIGNSAQPNNLFDNLDFGIIAYIATIDVKWNRFQNMTGSDDGGSPVGIGIYAALPAVSTKALTPTLTVGNNNATVNNAEKNYFINCLRGVWTDYWSNAYINNNTFDCETTATTFTTGPVTGEYGVYNSNYCNYVAPPGRIEHLQFANNNCQNYSTGFYHDFQKLGNTASAGSSILSNTITATTNANNYCKYGVYLQQSTNPGANSGVPQDAISIKSNTINNVNANCISINSVNTNTATSGFIDVSQNTELSVKYKSGAALVDKISALRINNSYYTQVHDNTVIKTTGITGSYPSTLAQYLGGVYVYKSPNSKIYCNTTSDLGEDFTWEGASAGSVWKSNTMQESRYGLVLRASGVMGDQGSSAVPIYDVFNNDITSAHTLCDGSNPGGGTTSKLYTSAATCTAVTTYQPCSNSQINGVAYTATGGTVTLLSASGAATYSCIGSGGGGRMIDGSTQGGLGNSSPQDSLRAELDSMIMSNIPYPAYDFETHWAMQYYVSSVDTGVHVMQGYDNAKKFALADGQFAAGNFVQAQTINNSIAAGNVIENNWQTVNAILINTALDTSYRPSSSDTNNLKAIASQCPLTGGSIVFRARAILNSYYKTLFEYPDVCPETEVGLSKEINSLDTKIKADLVNIYPNPNNGNMTVEYEIKNGAVLEISDISGKLVGKYNLPCNSTKVLIASQQIENGVYLYRIIGIKNVIKTGKIVVMK